jgi:polar amino acid transport system substrate-binding protein
MRLAAVALSLAFTSVAWAGDLAQIEKTGILKVIAEKHEAPEMFAFTDTAAPGFEREMLEGFARLHRLKLVSVPVPTSDERIPTLIRGEGDVIVGLVDTEAARKVIDLTSEVIPARHLALSRKPTVLESRADLLAAKVGVVKGTSWAAAAAEAGVPVSKTEFFADREELLAALKDGRVTATVMTVSDFTLAAKRDPELVAGPFLGPAGSAGWGVRKSDAQLRNALDDYLHNLRMGPSWSRMVVKYFGEQALVVLGRK